MGARRENALKVRSQCRSTISDQIKKWRTLRAHCMRTQKTAETPERISHEESDTRIV